MKLNLDTNSSPTRTVTIDNVPDEVLLEIFDLYRQTLGDPLNSERVWNNKNGWFKLAHVCHNWRAVVLASPFRLRLRLYFAGDTPTRAAALNRLAHLPIIVDYNNVVLNASAQKRLISALRYPDRVCRMAITNTVGITEALDSPFPALEGLELNCVEHTLPTSFKTSIKSLRHLRLAGPSLTSFFPLFSVTKALVDLTLRIGADSRMAKGASLLTHLQHIPHLRNLQVSTGTTYLFPPSSPIEIQTTTSVSLAELTSFRFSGEFAEMEWFVAGLVTPSLRELHISVFNIFDSDIPHIPHLSEFICVAGIVFFAARLTFSGVCLSTSLFAHPHSSDDPPSKIVTINTQFGAQPDSALSAMLATIEEVFLSLSTPMTYFESLLVNLESWCKVFEDFRNVKVLRLQHGLTTKVADMLRLPTANPPSPQEEVDPDATTASGTPINSNGSQFPLDIFPSLEEIVLYAWMPDRSIGETERASVLESFGPFATARQEMGRPVKVFWNTHGEVPRYFTTAVEDLR
jgi:hypothetical protein